jgi:hypothetical protein
MSSTGSALVGDTQVWHCTGCPFSLYGVTSPDSGQRWHVCLSECCKMWRIARRRALFYCNVVTEVFVLPCQYLVQVSGALLKSSYWYEVWPHIFQSSPVARCWYFGHRNMEWSYSCARISAILAHSSRWYEERPFIRLSAQQGLDRLQIWRLFMASELANKVP